MLKELWHQTAKVLAFIYVFLVVYGTVRTGIDKVIEMKQAKKEKVLSEILHTDEGRKNLAKIMTENLSQRRHE